MTIIQNGNTLSFFDGFKTKEDALKDYVNRLGSIATITTNEDKNIVINYNDGRNSVVII